MVFMKRRITPIRLKVTPEKMSEQTLARGNNDGRGTNVDINKCNKG
jgi:hypothetical protein